MRDANEAIIVVDVQNDFCAGGTLEVPDGAVVVPEINARVPEFPVRVFTQDWHPPRHSSFASEHPAKSPFETAQMPYGPQILWPDHCVQGAPGAAFHPELDTAPADLILRKGFRREVDSYSAFFENDHATPTGLDGYLRARGVDTVTVVGLATDFCVQFSTLDAARLGYRVVLEQRACGGIDIDGSLDAARAAMRAAGVHLAA